MDLAIPEQQRLALSSWMESLRVNLHVRLAQAIAAVDVTDVAALLGQMEPSEIGPSIAHKMIVITITGSDKIEQRLQMLRMLLSEERFTVYLSYFHSVSSVEIAEELIVLGRIDPIAALQCALNFRSRSTLEMLLQCPTVIAAMNGTVAMPGEANPIRASQCALDLRSRSALQALLACSAVVDELDRPLFSPLASQQ